MGSDPRHPVHKYWRRAGAAFAPWQPPHVRTPMPNATASGRRCPRGSDLRRTRGEIEQTLHFLPDITASGFHCTGLSHLRHTPEASERG